MPAFQELFPDRKPLIGMVHLGPLPGSARDAGDLRAVIERAVRDAVAIREGGLDGIMLENFFDSPFHKSEVPAVTVSAMTAAALAIREAVPIPLGINVLRNDVVSAVSIAHVCGADFVRCNVFVGAVVADQGVIEGAAREALETRRNLRAEVGIWADVGVKHARALAPSSLAEEARDAVQRGLADALIVSGSATGSPTDPDSAREVKESIPGVPVLIGSGFSTDNAGELLSVADGAIVGTHLKLEGKVQAPVDPNRIAALMKAISR